MIVQYGEKNRIKRNSMKDKGNGIYLGHYNDKTGLKIGETSMPFVQRWSLLSHESQTGFHAIFYHEVGDYGKATELIRQTLEVLIRTKVANYSSGHAKIYSFQGDSFICSAAACDKLINYICAENDNWDKYFNRAEDKLFSLIMNMEQKGISFPTRRETLGYLLREMYDVE